MAEKEKPSTRRDAQKNAMEGRSLGPTRPRNLFPSSASLSMEQSLNALGLDLPASAARSRDLIALGLSGDLPTAPISGLVSAGIQAPTVDAPNYSTVDPFTTAPLLPTNAMPGIGYAQSPQESINPSVDLNKLKPQFQDIVLPPIIPKPPSSVDPQVLLNQALQKRAQQAAMDVELRRQQQLEQGVGGKYGDGTYFPKNSSAVADYLNQAVPQSQLQGFRAPDAGSTGLVKVVPGIGHVTQVQQSDDNGYGNVMTGRYGTGSATFSDKPRTTGGTITENGKQVPIADWLKDPARRQGESNQFFNKDGRKIVPDKVA